MRKMSTIVSQLIDKPNVVPFFLVSIPALDLYLTTLQYDVTMSNGVTYSSDGGLTSVDPPRLSNVVDRESYKVTLADPDFELRPVLDNGAVGTEIDVVVGFLNPSLTAILGSDGVYVDHYQPLRDMRDTVRAYKGVLDMYNYNIDFSNNEITLTLEGSSPMANLDQIKVFYTSKDQMRQRNPIDSSFDDVYKGSAEVSLKWGKE